MLIDEMLRFDSPVQIATRIALEPINFGDVTVPTGRIVVLMLGAANHEPLVFDNPEQLDISVARKAGHLSFGSGIHYCLGAAIARAEGEVVVSEVIRRFPNLTLIDEPRMRPTFELPGPRTPPCPALNARL